MAFNLTPLVGTTPTRKGQPQVGDLVTVTLARSLDGSDPSVQCGALLERIAGAAYFVKLVGLEIPEGFQLGERFPLNRQAVVDW